MWTHAGACNGGRISDKELDAKMDSAKLESDPTKRDALLLDALAMVKTTSALCACTSRSTPGPGAKE